MKRILFILLIVTSVICLMAGCAQPAESDNNYDKKSRIKDDYREDISDEMESQIVDLYNVFAGLANRGIFKDLDTYNELSEDMDAARLCDELQTVSSEGGLGENEILFSLYLSRLGIFLDKIERDKAYGDEDSFTDNANVIIETIADFSENLE